MSKSLVTFPSGDTRKCRGRNHFNADAVGVEVIEHEDALRIFGRVASNGKTDIGYVSMPNDKSLIAQLIGALQAQLDQADTEEEIQRAQAHEWITSNGQSVKLGEISNRHLVHLIRYLKRQISGIVKSDEDALAMWCDDKISIGFTGSEDTIARLEETLNFAEIEKRRRIAGRIAIPDPEDQGEIPFS